MPNIVPDNFIEAELEAVAALGADAEIGENKKAGVFVFVHGVFEMIKRGDDGSGGAARATILQPMQLRVVVRLGKTGEHEVVGVLEE